LYSLAGNCQQCKVASNIPNADCLQQDPIVCNSSRLCGMMHAEQSR
jgi:hypothetical protein